MTGQATLTTEQFTDAQLRAHIRELAETLMGEHLVESGWTFEFDRAVRRFGQCSYAKKRITVSFPLARANPIETTRDTILHEIAHAIVGPGHGHDHVWRRTALSVGCSGERTTEGADPGPEALPWTGTCPNGHVSRRARAPQRVASCAKCSPVFDQAYLFKWVGPNGQKPKPPAWQGVCTAGHAFTRARKPQGRRLCGECASRPGVDATIIWLHRDQRAG